MSAHTPGPWTLGPVGFVFQRVTARGGFVVADVTHGNEAEAAQREANARLIAAAPDLLEALDELLEHVEWRRRSAGEKAGPQDVTHRARAALAKARGTP